MSIVQRGWIALYILCLWVEDQKNTILTYKKWRIFAWKKAGDLPQDYTSAYSETPGELKEHNKKQLEKAMKAPIDQDAIRRAGW